MPEIAAAKADSRFVGIGAMCLVAAAGLEVWASYWLIDPGYFARTSVFLEFVLLAGVCVLVTTSVTDAWLTRLRVKARETLRERTVARLISADRFIAHGLSNPDA